MYNIIKNGRPDFETVTVKGEGQMVDGTWYYVVKPSEKKTAERYVSTNQ